MTTKWNWLERTVFAVSCVLVASVVGYLGVDAWTLGHAPPDLVVTVGKPLPGAGGWRVPITVMNQGDLAAEQVRVEVVSDAPGRAPERAEFSLSYVPRRSRREAWVSFHHEPTPTGLRVRPLGYAQP